MYYVRMVITRGGENWPAGVYNVKDLHKKKTSSISKSNWPILCSKKTFKDELIN